MDISEIGGAIVFIAIIVFAIGLMGNRLAPEPPNDKGSAAKKEPSNQTDKEV